MVNKGNEIPPVDALIERVLQYRPSANTAIIKKAYAFGQKAHAGQYRRSGEPYFYHPATVARLLADLELDEETIVAGLLHDVVEDCDVSLDQIEQEFGADVAILVDGVTKLSQLEDYSREEQQAENLRKMFLAMAKDIRVILIKLADRLHNMRTLKALRPERQQAISQETIEIYAPLAHRLGIYRLKWELEDLALRYLEPETYSQITELVATRRAEREQYIQQLVFELKDALKAHKIDSDIQGRPKNFYSIAKKMHSQGKQFDQILDLTAVRVLVDSVKDCYGALGVVHTLFKPVPGRFKDYIAMPKPNYYQSLHTTVIGPSGEPIEIQIRTWEMHRTSEYGIAAHWRYKEGQHGDLDFDQKLSWLRQVLEWQHELRDAREFIESLKIDLFADEVFVFTPKGAVIDLPAGATPVDFAYRIHTDVGNRCIGAKANGKIVSLDTSLQNGDIVEILTSKVAQGPSADWLNFVKTSGAKNRVRQWFKVKNREEHIHMGRELVERELKRLGLDPKDALRTEWLDEVRKKYNAASIEDLLAMVGRGTLTSAQIGARLREKKPLDSIELPQLDPKEVWQRLGYGKPSNGVRVKGVDNVLVRFSRCCTPVPDDPIVGYITRGRGVSVHRSDCINMPDLKTHTERMVEVVWDQSQAMSFPVEVEIHALDRPGLLADVSRVVAETRVNIVNAKARGYRNRTAIVTVMMEIRHLGELRGIIEKLERLPDVLSVERVLSVNSGPA